MKLLKIPWYFTFALLVWCNLASCKKDPKPEDCGCNGTTVKNIYRLSASYSSENIFFFLDPEFSGSTPNVANFCDTTLVNPAWKQDRAKFNYLISGELKTMCGRKDFIPYLPSFMFIPSKIEEI